MELQNVTVFKINVSECSKTVKTMFTLKLVLKYYKIRCSCCAQWCLYWKGVNEERRYMKAYDVNPWMPSQNLLKHSCL